MVDRVPRVRRVLETAIYCEDLHRTAEFYKRLLNAVPMLEGDRLVALDAGQGTVLLLFQRGRTTTPLDLPEGRVPAHDGSGPTHFAFAIDADDLIAWQARLMALDIPVESIVAWDGGGRSLYFRDPDGRSVELATPGIWPNY
jgi:catechol 2,3-dioxygenase-like lactoylglutathione lyase family enzyme